MIYPDTRPNTNLPRHRETSTRRDLQIVCVLALALLCVFCSGCYEPTIPPELVETSSLLQPQSKAGAEVSSSDEQAGEEGSESQEEPFVEMPVSEAAWITESQLPWEIGYVQYLDNRRIGFFILRVEKSAIEAKNRVSVIREESVDVTVAGKPTSMTSKLEAFEQTNGDFKSFSMTTMIGSGNSTTNGRVQGASLLLETTQPSEGAAKTQKRSIPWDKKTWGVLGLHALLLRDPPEPGAKIRSKVLVPQAGDIAQLEMVARTKELTPLPEGVATELTAVDVKLSVPNGELKSTYWVRDDGMIEKMISQSGPKLVTFRVPLETIRRLETQRDIERLAGLSVRLAEPMQLPPETDLLTFSIESDSSDPFAILAANQYQTKQSISPRAAEVSISRQPLPDTPAATTADSSSEDYLASDDFITAQHEVILEFANELLAGSEAQTDSEKVNALVEKFSDVFTLTDFSSNFSSPLAVARKKQGNICEASALLLTLLRSQDIPARFAVGLKLSSPAHESLAFHMWIKAEIDGRWQRIDPYQNTAPLPDRIELSDQEFDSSNPGSIVARTLQKLQAIESISLVSSNATE